MKKKVITVCDECEKPILKKTELIQLTQYGCFPYMIITSDFCSKECAEKKLEKTLNKNE